MAQQGEQDLAHQGGDLDFDDDQPAAAAEPPTVSKPAVPAAAAGGGALASPADEDDHFDDQHDDHLFGAPGEDSSPHDRELFTNAGPHPNLAAGAILGNSSATPMVQFGGEGGTSAGGGSAEAYALESFAPPASALGGSYRASVIYTEATQSPLRASAIFASRGQAPPWQSVPASTAQAQAPRSPRETWAEDISLVPLGTGDTSPIATGAVHAAANLNPHSSEAILAAKAGGGGGLHNLMYDQSCIGASEVHAAVTLSPIRSEALVGLDMRGAAHLKSMGRAAATAPVTAFRSRTPPPVASSGGYAAHRESAIAAHNLTGGGGGYTGRGMHTLGPGSPISAESLVASRNASASMTPNDMRRYQLGANSIAARGPAASYIPGFGGIPAHHLAGPQRGANNASTIRSPLGATHPPYWALHGSEHMPVSTLRPNLIPYIYRAVNNGVHSLDIELAVTQKMQHGRRAELATGGRSLAHDDHHMRYHFP